MHARFQAMCSHYLFEPEFCNPGIRGECHRAPAWRQRLATHHRHLAGIEDDQFVGVLDVEIHQTVPAHHRRLWLGPEWLRPKDGPSFGINDRDILRACIENQHEPPRGGSDLPLGCIELRPPRLYAVNGDERYGLEDAPPREEVGAGVCQGKELGEDHGAQVPEAGHGRGAAVPAAEEGTPLLRDAESHLAPTHRSSVAATQVLHLEQLGRVLFRVDLALELPRRAVLGLHVNHRERVIDRDARALVDQ